MNETPTAGKKIPRKKRFVFAALAGLFLFIICETGLRLSGLFPDPRPFTEFTGEDGKAMVRCNLSKLQPPFPREPEPGAYRIIVAGESTAVGFPYQPRSSFGLRLQALMEDAEPGLNVELINLSRVGMHSGEVAEVIAAAREYHPALIIVYSGQNEFISQERKPPAWARPALKIVSRLKTAQAIGGLVALAVGQGREKFMRGLEEEPEQALILRRPPPISAGEYAGVIDEFRGNAASFASPPGGPPVVVMAQAVNLRGWPPAAECFSRSFTEQDREKASQALADARQLIEENKFDEAVTLLEKEREQRPGYAEVSFELGRARSKLLERENENPPHPLKDPEKTRREALADFKRALAEEAHAVISHRAPPEINAALQETAAKNGVLFFDTETVMDEATWLAPGFDVFDDHCHPNLFGQQIISEALFEFLKENLPSFPATGDPGTWDENGFLEIHNIDGEFLHKIDLNLGIFLGLKMRFPDHGAAIREKLLRAAEERPEDPMPLIIGTLVAAQYPPPRPEAILLSNFQGENPRAVDRALARWFTSMVALRQDVLMAKLDPGRDLAPLSGLLKSGLFHNETTNLREEDLGCVEYYNYFADLEDGGMDISGEFSEGKRAWRKTEGGPRALHFIEEEKGQALLPGPGAGVISALHGITYRITAPTYLSTGPIHVNPADYAEISVDYKMEGPEAGKASPELVLVYLDRQDRVRVTRMTLNGVEVSDGFLGYYFDTCRWPRWYLAREIIEIRVVPGIANGTFTIRQLTLSNTPP